MAQSNLWIIDGNLIEKQKQQLDMLLEFSKGKDNTDIVKKLEFIEWIKDTCIVRIKQEL